jgi:membrane-bound lytic murein transglycosylase D
MNWFGMNIYRPRNWKKICSVAILLMGFLQTRTFAATYSDSTKIVQAKKDTADSSKQNLNSTESLKDLITLNPKAVSFVQQYTQKQTKEYERMKVWGKPYFDMYDNILAQYGIPKEMKYLSVIESNLQPGTISWAGAVGPWQLMDYEGKRYGLRMGRGVDERMDFYKSTHAACKLIKELHEEFGDWLLVLAAYNGGVGRVKQCIKKANSRDFWDLQYYLPEETRNHVKKFIGTHYIFEGGGGITTMTAAETEKYRLQLNSQVTVQLTEEEIKNTSIVEVKGRYLSGVLTNYLLMDIDQFNKWNPGFDKALAEGKKYSLRLSKERAVVFQAKKSEILLESIRTLLNG